MKVPELAKLIDDVATRRRDRLRVLFALYLVRELADGRAVTAAQLLARLSMAEGSLQAALEHLKGGGYVEGASDHAGGLIITHVGVVAVESALTRVDRESGEFPPLRPLLMGEGLPA
jgi:hypothetical protein